MTPPLAAFSFVVSLLAMLGAAQLFAGRLDRLGLSLGLPEALLGLLTALAADSPEVASAVAALVRGERGVAVGVVVGSNAFNIAAMLGLSAIVAAGIRAKPESVVLEGFVGVWVTGVVCALLAHAFPAAVGLVLIALVVVPYVALLMVGPRGVRRRHVPLLGDFLRRSFGEGHMAPRLPPSREDVLLRPLALLLAALAVIVAASSLMVASSVDLAGAWGIPRPLLGVLVLAVLTSLPNAVTGVRFGLHGRGSALVSETLNSNSINLVVGLAVPSAVASLGARGGLDIFDLGWLALMTAVVLALFARRGGVSRNGGLLLVVLYGIFVAVQVIRLT